MRSDKWYMSFICRGNQYRLLASLKHHYDQYKGNMMIPQTSAFAFRQNLGEMLNQVQYRHDSVVINKDGKPVAALVDARLFERIRRMQERFEALCKRIELGFEGVPEADGLQEIDVAVALERAAHHHRLVESGMATLRVVLDTNVLLSGIAYPTSTPGKIMAAWRHGSIEVILSALILDELQRVLPRLVSRHGLTTTEIGDLVDILSIQAEVIEPLNDHEAELRDTDDQTVLGTYWLPGSWPRLTI
jgi:putative PIN family toxin of toxin-antitoxin system